MASYKHQLFFFLVEERGLYICCHTFPPLDPRDCKKYSDGAFCCSWWISLYFIVFFIASSHKLCLNNSFMVNHFFFRNDPTGRYSLLFSVHPSQTLKSFQFLSSFILASTTSFSACWCAGNITIFTSSEKVSILSYSATLSMSILLAPSSQLFSILNQDLCLPVDLPALLKTSASCHSVLPWNLYLILSFAFGSLSISLGNVRSFLWSFSEFRPLKGWPTPPPPPLVSGPSNFRQKIRNLLFPEHTLNASRWNLSLLGLPQSCNGER